LKWMKFISNEKRIENWGLKIENWGLKIENWKLIFEFFY
jgi:hypothetical protein